MTKYQVASGDTLSRIAERFYGDARLFTVISIANGMTDPSLISVGQELFVPYVTYRHTVSFGDTLAALARAFYDDSRMSDLIAGANHIKNPDLIDVGDSLLIPDLTRTGHHTMVPGETLSSLAEDWYGDASLYSVISVPNRIADPNVIQAGRVLMRPGLNFRHRVLPGETLISIADYHYADSSRAALIGAANHRRLFDPIYAGEVLFLPDLSEF